MEQELLTLLKQREEAARHRVEGLRAELAALNERTAAAEEELSDLVVTQTTLARVFAERDAYEPEFEQRSGGTARLTTAGSSSWTTTWPRQAARMTVPRLAPSRTAIRMCSTTSGGTMLFCSPRPACQACRNASNDASHARRSRRVRCRSGSCRAASTKVSLMADAVWTAHRMTSAPSTRSASAIVSGRLSGPERLLPDPGGKDAAR